MIWHPAETAPKDGVAILVWWVGSSWPPEVVRYDALFERWMTKPGYPVGGFHYWTPISKPEGKE